MDVLHYHVFSPTLADLMCRICGIPTISYFDDFVALLPASRDDNGLEGLTRWRQLRGIPLKIEKSEADPEITFPGLMGPFPPVKGQMKLSGAHTEERKCDGLTTPIYTWGMFRPHPPITIR